jgi:hypothetical protein
MRITGKNIKGLVIISMILFSASCRKNGVCEQNLDTNSIEDCPGCEPLAPWSGGMFDQTYHDSISYCSPLFNPNNNDEIIFLQYNEPYSLTPSLYKLNLITGEKTFIYEGPLSGIDITWGDDDWILLPLTDHQIWKIKSDGSNLTQVTSDGKWFHPVFNPDGNRFVAWRGYVNNNSENYRYKIWDMNGNVIDSFFLQECLVAKWSNTGFGGTNSTEDIIVMDPSSGEIISQINTPLENYQHFSWISESEALITALKGVFRYNIYSHTFTKLKCHCSSRRFLISTVNNDQSKVIFQVTEYRRLEDEPTIMTKSYLVMTNIDGTNEQVIDIPD